MSDSNHQGETFTELIVEIFRLNGLILEAGDRIAQPVCLTSARWQTLGIVEHGPLPVAHVARLIGLSRQTIQQTADGLARDGFIVYRQNPHHRRAKLMEMTQQGAHALVYVRGQQAVWAQHIGATHSVADLRQALEALRGLRKSLEADNTHATSKRSIVNEAEPSESDCH